MTAHKIRSWNDQQVELLSRMSPAWDIWCVPVYMGPDIWCAKPKGHPIATINCDSPEGLVEAIREQSASPSPEQ